MFLLLQKRAPPQMSYSMTCIAHAQPNYVLSLHNVLPFIMNKSKLKAMLREAIFLQLATQRWRIKNLSSCKGDVTRKQLVSQRYEK